MLSATAASAAAPEVNLSLFRPATGGDGYAAVEGARPLDPGAPLEVRFWLDGATKTLLYLPGAGGEQTVLRNRLGGWLVAQAHLLGPLSLAVQIPVTLNQSGDLTNLPPSSRGPSSTPAGLSDLRLSQSGVKRAKDPFECIRCGAGSYTAGVPNVSQTNPPRLIR